MGKKLVFLSFILSIFIWAPAISQNLSDGQNLQNINVDELSDEQIQKFIKQVEAGGYTEDQLEILAKARGMSSAQISKLRQRINEVRNKRPGSNTSDDGLSRLRSKPGVSENKETEFDPFSDFYVRDTVKTTEGELPIFGMSFFKNKELTFEPSLNVPTPKDYLLGPGDQIIIDIWGASEQNYQLSVSPEGSVFIPNIGPIYLNGLTIERADVKLRSKLKSIYSTLGDNTFAQVSLGQIRTISVNVIGEVTRPGTYQISSFATAFNALYMAGGPSKNGSLREIVVFRGGKKVASFDAYAFLAKGEGQNIKLQDQDVLMVKPYKNRIGIDGEVKRPAYYELTVNETIGELIELAGGFTSEAYTKSISLRRNEANFKTVKTVETEKFSERTLKNGDFIEVGKISNQFRNRVRVEGAVNHSGEFEFIEGMMLSELIAQADGFRDDAFMKQALIIRENDDLTLSNQAFVPSEMVAGQYDIELQSGDLVKVQSIFDLQEDFTLSIEGQVLEPDEYPFVSGMTVENLVYLAGGFKEGAAKSFVEVARRVSEDSGDRSFASQIFNFPISQTLSLSEEASSFELMPFDLVVIRKSPFYEKQAIVEIEGEVEFPGKYALEKKNERISDVLNRAGNLTNFAYPEGATLIRRTEYFANGDDEGKEAAKIRRKELQELFERDTLLQGSKQAFKTQESIGIELQTIMDDPGSEYDLILKEGDIISIPRELQTVRVRGQVLYPSTIRYSKSDSFRKVVAQAGGFSDRALKKKSYIIYANGTAQKTNSFLWFKSYPKVAAGAELIVPEEPPKRKLTPGEIVGISSGLTTLSWVVFQIVNSL